MASFAITSQGHVWAWGTSKRGALAMGSGTTFIPMPTKVPGLHGIKQLACGWGHALAVTGTPAQSLHCRLAALAGMDLIGIPEDRWSA